MSFSNVVTELSLLSLPSIYRSDRSVTSISTRGDKSDSFVTDEPAKVALLIWNPLWVQSGKVDPHYGKVEVKNGQVGAQSGTISVKDG